MIRVEPTNGQNIERELSSKRIAAANRWGDADWVVPSDTDINASRDGELATGPLGAFARTDDGTSLTVTFDTGEAFRGGAYIASDDATIAEHSVDLAASTNNQTVYLGWDLSTADSLIIGLSGDFGTHDPKAAIYEFDTDSSSVTASEDLRALSRVGGGQSEGNLIAETTDTDGTTPLTLDTGTISNPYPRYVIHIALESQQDGTQHAEMRLNGVLSTDYYYDYYDAYNNTFDSVDGDDEFDFLAGTDRARLDYYNAIAQQTIVVDCPTEVGSVNRRFPTCSTDVTGVGKNISYLVQGNLKLDVQAVDRLHIHDGGNATGQIVIRGVDPFS